MTARREAWLPALVLVLMGAAFLAMPPDEPGLVQGAHAAMAVFLVAHAVAATVAVLRKVAGALLLVASGFGMLAQTVATLWLAHRCGSDTDSTIVHYYAVFWTPAALLSLVAGAALVRPVLALLRR